MTSLATLARLHAVHRRLLALAASLPERDYRTQYHVDLSPIGWHLGHCAFVENYWLRERIQGDDRLTRGLHDYYIPERSPKPQRGPRLPPKDELLSRVQAQNEANILLLSGASGPLPADPLLEDEYLENFLIQHHSQHYETMLMVLAQRAMKRHGHNFFPDRRLRPAEPSREFNYVPGGTHRIGGGRPQAFDNELPAHRVQLEDFHIGLRPVSNAEYLGFMEAGGYTEPGYWTPEGRAWLSRSGAQAPEHWRRDARGWWYGIGPTGPYELDPEAPVHGLCWYEARAYATYAGARLPHEFEWEAAGRLGRMELTGRVWEWCANSFFPYPGFEAFPYEGYSVPWFGGDHYTLKGGSRYTRREVRRLSFRNFFNPDKRHVFAGIRLAC